jgi:chromosome segregation ATPase
MATEPEIDIGPDHITLDGRTFPRSRRMSASQWIAFWEAVRAIEMSGSRADLDEIERLRDEIADLKMELRDANQEVRELQREVEQLQMRGD